MRALLRKSRIYFALLTAAALALRLFFVLHFPNIAGDSFFYGELAKTWLQHGILGTSAADGIHPSLVRLPGYPAFLAGIWAITGVEHYRAVLLVQAFIDVGTVFVITDLAWRTLRSGGAAKLAFLLAAVCPFTANYAACALTETLAIFFAALALDAAAAAFDSGRQWHWAGCGAAISAGILLRPDGGILLAVIGAYLMVRCCRDLISCLAARPAPWARGAAGPLLTWIGRAAVLSVVALAPLLPWTIRNWRDFHVLQPLAPRYANAPGQFVPMGFQRWVKTWMVDYVSVADIYWPLEDSDIEVDNAPRRAFDSEDERQAVGRLFAQYNTTHDWTPELDFDLDKIAGARVARHPLRYYVWLPAGRITDMWLRPRTEMIGLEDRWWRVTLDPQDAAIAIALGTINLFYVGAAFFAITWILRANRRRPADGAPSRTMAPSPYWVLLPTFILVRSLFLGTLENPEPRYTLECYPVVIVFAAAALVLSTKKPIAARKAVAQKVTPAVEAG